MRIPVIRNRYTLLLFLSCLVHLVFLWSSLKHSWITDKDIGDLDRKRHRDFRHERGGIYDVKDYERAFAADEKTLSDTQRYLSTSSRGPIIHLLIRAVRKETNQTITQNLLQLPEDEFMKEQTSILEARKLHLRNMCQKYQSTISDPIAGAGTLSEFLVDDNHKIGMCVTAKIAGKSWKKVFNVLAGYANSTSEQVDGVKAVNDARNIRRLSSYTPEEIEYIFNEYTLFMFSRHPLTRSLSAYNNLMSPNATEKSLAGYQNLEYEIIKQYRPWTKFLSAFGIKNQPYDLSFHEFVKFLVDNKIRSSRRDNHWIENYKFCHPCDIPYKVVGKYETLLEDAKYILKLTKLDNKVSFPESEGPQSTSTHSSNFHTMMSFYDQVPLGDLQKLIKRYELEYILFNYRLPSFSGLLGGG